VTARMLLGQPARPVPAARERRVRGVRLLRLRRLALAADLVRERQRLHGVDEPLAPAAPADRENDGRPGPGTDDDVVRAAGAVDEIPGPQRALLAFDEQQALAGEDQKAFLRALAMVEPERLAGLEDVDVDPELAEGPLALEVAVEAEAPGVEPAA